MLVTKPLSETLSVRRLSTVAEFDEFAGAWNLLAGDVPFRSYEWIEAWWRHYEQPGMEPFVLVVLDEDGEVAGLAPWYRKQGALFGRTLGFLGSGEVCSEYLTLLAQPEQAERVTRQIADWLAGEGRSEWDAIELEGIDQTDETLAALIDALGEHGCPVRQRQRINAWRLELPADWDGYLRKLSKSRRGGVRTLQRRYFDTGRAVLRTAESEEDVERGLKILHDLHQRRRQSLGDAGCFASSRFAGFLHEAAQRFYALGRLRLQWIDLDDRPVAAAFDLCSSDTVFHYQSGIDPNAMQDKPGWLMQISSLKQAIGEGFHAYDFLRGDEPYKALWRAERLPLVEVRASAPRISSRLRHGIWSAGVCGKNCLRNAAAWLNQRRASRSANAASNE